VSKTSTTEPQDVFDKVLFQQLARGRWIAFKQNLILIDAGGVGKSWLACVLAEKAASTIVPSHTNVSPGCSLN
jgi:DNA replication protein DnaC